MSDAQHTAQRTIAIYQEAARANLNTSGRAGNTVALTGEFAGDVMITGDLHGNRTNFKSILKTADLDRHPRRHLVLQEVCHGGPSYPNAGGCMSHLLLAEIARLKTLYPDRLHLLLGNHELAEMVDYPIQKNRQLLNLAFRLGLYQMHGDMAEEVRQAALTFLRSCPLAVRLSEAILVTHSLPEGVDQRGFDTAIFWRRLNDADFEAQGGVFALVWGRDYRPENARAFAELAKAQVLINGHEPCPYGFLVPNATQIILDCCGPRACYLLLPVDQEPRHAAIFEKIQRLG